MDINDSGVIAGYAETQPPWSPTNHAVMFTPGRLLDLDVLPGLEFSSAHRVNRAGHVLGNCSARPERSRGFIHRDGRMIDIGTLPGDTDSLALDFNNLDHVVGVSSRFEVANGERYSVDRPIIWADGAMWDLQSLIPPNSDWIFQAPVGINDRGQIIAVGDHRAQGLQRTCLLTPVPARPGGRRPSVPVPDSSNTPAKD